MKIKKLAVLLTAAALTASAVAGCSGAKETEAVASGAGAGKMKRTMIRVMLPRITPGTRTGLVRMSFWWSASAPATMITGV